MTSVITINCDLGEGLDDIDAQVMPYLHLANIACGGHAGDSHSMLRTSSLASQFAAQIGAHPSYPDRDNFGRTSLNIDPDRLYPSLQQQVQSLIDICHAMKARVQHIKPHGALYNDAISKPDIRHCLYRLATEFQLPLILQALPSPQHHVLQKEARQSNVPLIFEAFADRTYTAQGRLVSRKQANAVHSDLSMVIAQVENLINRGGVFAENGQWLELKPDTICVHSDSPNAVQTIQAVRQSCNAN